MKRLILEAFLLLLALSGAIGAPAADTNLAIPKPIFTNQVVTSSAAVTSSAYNIGDFTGLSADILIEAANPSSKITFTSYWSFTGGNRSGYASTKSAADSPHKVWEENIDYPNLILTNTPPPGADKFYYVITTDDTSATLNVSVTGLK